MMNGIDSHQFRPQGGDGPWKGAGALLGNGVHGAPI